jgi:predicted HD phosphohydrolase
VRPYVSVEELVAALTASAAHDDDEDVDLLAHGLQCAELLASWAADDRELQLAGLVHDIAHDAPAAAHAGVGSALVARLLGPRVAWLVAHHVDAKRLLVAEDPAYAESLSPRSRATLVEQGGPLSADQAARLADDPDIAALRLLRRADDGAKVAGAPTRPLSAWEPVLAAVSAATTSR